MKWYYMIVPFLATTGIAFGQTEKQVELPRDQNNLHLSVVGIATDAQYQLLTKWFHGELADFRRQVHYHQITADQSVYRERYEPNISGLPTVRLQEPDGTVIYEVADNDVPTTAADLDSELQSAIAFSKACPWRRRCPVPKPEPVPEPLPDVEPFVPLEPEPEPDFLWYVILIWAGGVGAGLVGGLVYEWRESHV